MPKRKPTDFAELKLRLREELRKRVEQSARDRESSLNAELIRRLEESYEREERLYDRFGGEHIAGVLLAVGSAISFVEREKGKRWNEGGDVDVTVQALAAIYATLKGFLFLGEEDVKRLVRDSGDNTGLIGAMLALKASGFSEEEVGRRWATELPEPQSPLARLLKSVAPDQDKDPTPEPKSAPKKRTRK